MCRNGVQYRGEKPEASSLRPSACASDHPIPLPAVCSACRPALPPRWRARQGAPVGASDGHPCLTPGCARLQRPGCARPRASPPPAFGRVPPRASAGHPAPQGFGRAARSLGGCAPGRPPTRLRRAWPLSATPRACGARPCGVRTRVPRALAGGGDGGSAPHARPARLGAPRGRGAPDGHPATGRCAPSALRAVAAHPACPTRVRARLPPAPGACAPGRGCAPRFAAPPRQGLRPRHPTGRGLRPRPVPHPLLAARAVVRRRRPRARSARPR